ncbi:MAG TPA: lipid-binding SYLF domain-containing protein [Candidatus Polarisedimenticolia bacterium]|nr:lipid-binding SYLF domain-containing protein [Candidatus Polarisedimenticolia bacterium]
MTTRRVSASLALFAVLFAALFAIPAVAGDRKVEDYSATIAEFKKIPQVAAFFGKCAGYAVFPTVGKGGLGIGASHGKGQVYEGGKVIGFTATTDLSIGFQAGGQAYSQIIFFENAEALKNFTSGNFEFNASASAIAIQSSAGAKAGTEGTGADASKSKTAEKTTHNAEYQNGVVVFTMAKGGLMYAATIAGQKYSYEAVK